MIEGGQTADERRVGSVVAGKYRLEDFLSRGGMGAVYRATHVMLVKPCAVKVIRPDLVTSPEFVRRFLREARAAAGLNHPNIVDVFDLGEAEDGTLYIAMELVQGRSLQEVIREEGRIPPSRIVHVMRQVASALALAHRQHIVHRDLKPQNLMVARDSGGRESVKLLDFGIAKTFDESTELTATGMMLGTPQYMAPEQVMGHAIDHRTDLYAFGVILYQMLVGEVPFNSPSTPALLMKHVNDLPELPSLRRPDLRIPTGLEAIALRCLEKDPARRFQSADELADALERALIESEVQASSSPASNAPTVALPRPSAPPLTPTASQAPTPAAQAAAPSATSQTPMAAPATGHVNVPAHTTWWRLPAVGLAAILIVTLAAWAAGVFRSSPPSRATPTAQSTEPSAPATQPPSTVPASTQTASESPAVAAPPPRDSGDAKASTRSSEPPSKPTAAPAPPPAVPSIWLECEGAREVCGPVSLAFEQAIENERLPVAARADAAEVLLAIRATAAQDREQKSGGLMWQQTFSIGVDGRAPRFRSAIPMPRARTLTFDSHFGRDAAFGVGRALATDAVAGIREFWKARVSQVSRPDSEAPLTLYPARCTCLLKARLREDSRWNDLVRPSQFPYSAIGLNRRVVNSK